MRVFVFLTYLYFLLLAGYHYIHTGSHDDRNCYSQCHSQTQNFEKDHHRLRFTDTSQGYSLIEDETPDDAEESLVSDEVEDEETNDLAGRKYKLLITYQLTFSDTFTLGSHLGSFRDQPPLFSHLPNKYITQRALRI